MNILGLMSPQEYTQYETRLMLEKKLIEAEKAFEDKKRALNAAINMWDIETKKLEIVRDCAVRYLDAEDMAAKRTCDKELLKALAAINGEG